MDSEVELTEKGIELLVYYTILRMILPDIELKQILAYISVNVLASTFVFDDLEN